MVWIYIYLYNLSPILYRHLKKENTYNIKNDWERIRYIMVNYKNGKIYKIQCFVTNKIYIGSTSQFYLSQRLKDHKFLWFWIYADAPTSPALHDYLGQWGRKSFFCFRLAEEGGALHKTAIARARANSMSARCTASSRRQRRHSVIYQTLSIPRHTITAEYPMDIYGIYLTRGGRTSSMADPVKWSCVPAPYGARTCACTGEVGAIW